MMGKKARQNAFDRCIREEGEAELEAYIARNELKSIRLCRNPINGCGDYDVFDKEEDILTLLRTGRFPYRLETQRLRLREMTQEDFADLCGMLMDPRVMTAYEGPFSREETQEWLDRQFARYATGEGMGLWAVTLREDGRMIGQAGVTRQNTPEGTVPEIGYLFKSDFWHHGYATEAARALKEYAFEILGVPVIYSIIRDTNTASQGVARRNGMKEAGRFVKLYRGVTMPHILFEARNENL